jgi:hypothetical protein
VTHCELFETLTALIAATMNFFKRYRAIPEKVCSIIGANRQHSHGCTEYAERWSTVKNALAEQRTIIRVDKSGFYLFPSRVGTYALSSQKLQLRVPLMWDHLLVSSGITDTEQRFTWVLETAFDGAGIM